VSEALESGSPTGQARWDAAWRGLGVVPPPAELRQAVLGGYAEPHRAYHTRQHLDECLGLLEQARELCRYPDEVALALWFHDAIYQPRQNDNEARSAEWLGRVARDAGVGGDAVARMQALVMATLHAAIPEGPDAQVLVDIDLAILGAPAPRFQEYERQVRLEYAWVEEATYRQVRGRLLQEFLGRPQLYSTPEFRQRFEPFARTNLAAFIQQLAQPA
jgi:predicted metal-dependent HD superfamily phosphohydrolase